MTNYGIFAINATELIGHNILLMEIDSTEVIENFFHVISKGEEWHIKIDEDAIEDDYSDLAQELKRGINDIKKQFDVDATALTWVW